MKHKGSWKEKLKASRGVEISLKGIMDEEINIVCNVRWL